MNVYREFLKRFPEEQVYFNEYARKFDDNPEEKRYGILILKSEPKEENMLYSDCPRELHSKHIDYLIKNKIDPRSDGAIVHDFINWLEEKEGKK